MVVDILDILDIPVVEGSLVAAAAQKGILVEDRGLSTLSDSNSTHTDQAKTKSNSNKNKIESLIMIVMLKNWVLPGGG